MNDRKARVRIPRAGAFPIVGIGASAGGLDAFRELLGALPADTGMAFILIQHLNPKHASFLVEALTRASTMRVTEAAQGVRVEPNRVYVIPPNADIAIRHGRLGLHPRPRDARSPHLPLDFFLRSLAVDRGEHAIGVVLSGNASDGTEGLEAIKAEHGITFAQDPGSAKHGGMPHSAVDAGVVDYALPIPALAQELVRLSRHPYVANLGARPAKNDPATLRKMFALIRSATGVDFGEYKAPTFERRLARRIALCRLADSRSYLKLLETDPEEIRRLSEDVLIHVTSFFRDPEVFEALKTTVFPAVLKGKPEDAAIRLWVPACATGEEVYSLAISLLEFLGRPHRLHPIQIFGSDVSEKAIETARAGIYAESAVHELSDERRKRFFTKLENGYQIKKSVRDLCVFVRHDLARDPPFSKLDLISCRNVLIYFDLALQKRVLATAHHALSQPGFLLLGRTESIAGFGRLFTATDRINKLFARTSAPSTLRFAQRYEVPPTGAQALERTSGDGPRRGVDVARHLDRLLLMRYSPPGVLINERLEILQFRGETGPYLQSATGAPQANLINMLRRGLFAPFRAALAQAKKTMTAARREATVEQNNLGLECRLAVVPFTGFPDSKGPLFMVLFEPVVTPGAKRAKPARAGRRRAAGAEAHRVPKLERELAATREYLASLVEEHDHANEELGIANEDLTSGNEELQSLNEELETAKEELQSTNEELTTVNTELQARNQDFTQINGDLLNLLGTVDIPILILDMERRIRRFTPKARAVVNVTPGDVGRPLEEIKSNLQVPDLDDRIAHAIESTTVSESEVKDRDGHWYRMQIRPYKTTDNRIDGAIVSFLDIDALKHLVSEADTARAEAERANRAKDQFLATLSHELRTPLSTMLLQAQLLRQGELDAAKTRLAGESIERGTRMQVQLIDDLLDVSRIVAGKLNLELVPVDMCAVVRAALEGVGAPASRKKTSLKVTLDEGIGAVAGDPGRLQQVVSNLLVNAIKFTPEGGTVTVVLENADGHARLTVSDTGMGIAPAFLPHVFSRFMQEDSSSTRTYGGLGLGLAIVRHLVEAHGGTVSAESAGTKQGAKFTVELPVVTVGRAHRTNGTAPDSGRPTPSYAGRLRDVRILVVDDDEGLRAAISEMLAHAGATVKAVASTAEAFVAVEDFRPKLLLSDIAMPGEDGYTFIRRVRALGTARGGNTPAVALTALAGEADRRQALAAGFQAYAAKPVDLDRLMAVVAEALEMRAGPHLPPTAGRRPKPARVARTR